MAPPGELPGAGAGRRGPGAPPRRAPRLDRRVPPGGTGGAGVSGSAGGINTVAGAPGPTS